MGRQTIPNLKTFSQSYWFYAKKAFSYLIFIIQYTRYARIWLLIQLRLQNPN